MKSLGEEACADACCNDDSDGVWQGENLGIGYTVALG